VTALDKCNSTPEPVSLSHIRHLNGVESLCIVLHLPESILALDALIHDSIWSSDVYSDLISVFDMETALALAVGQRMVDNPSLIGAGHCYHYQQMRVPRPNTLIDHLTPSSGLHEKHTLTDRLASPCARALAALTRWRHPRCNRNWIDLEDFIRDLS